MRLLLISLFVLALLQSPTSSTVIPHLGKAVPITLPHYKFQLDLPPEQRWLEIS